MTNLVTMKTRISDELVRDDLSSQIASAIAEAIKDHEGTRFFFNEKRFRLVTVADQEYYDLATALTNTDETTLSAGEGLIEIDSVTILDSGEAYTMNDRTQQAADRWQSLTTTGTPCDYALFGDQLRLMPIPDAVYTITISGLARLKTLSADSDTNAWMTEGEALIRHRAKKLIYRDVVRDPDGKALADEAEAEALMKLERKTAAKVGVGRIRPWGYR